MAFVEPGGFDKARKRRVLNPPGFHGLAHSDNKALLSARRRPPNPPLGCQRAACKKDVLSWSWRRFNDVEGSSSGTSLIDSLPNSATARCRCPSKPIEEAQIPIGVVSVWEGPGAGVVVRNSEFPILHDRNFKDEESPKLLVTHRHLPVVGITACCGVVIRCVAIGVKGG